jgi:hypothetical protein
MEVRHPRPVISPDIPRELRSDLLGKFGLDRVQCWWRSAACLTAWNLNRKELVAGVMVKVSPFRFAPEGSGCHPAAIHLSEKRRFDQLRFEGRSEARQSELSAKTGGDYY